VERLDLHPNDGVDEEEHGNEQDDVRQSLNEKTNTVDPGSKNYLLALDFRR
jgi:hypothetical protein